jgi:dihydroorotase-like cyclic amidohydrolase
MATHFLLGVCLPVVPYDGEWKDLGTWNALTDELKERCIGNVVMDEKSENTHVINELEIPVIFNGTDMLIAAHCEDQETIKNNIAKYKEMFAGENDIPIGKHPYIRSSAACYASSELAVRLARIAGARLHILHVSTAKELQLFNDYSLSEKHITAEACVAHLLFTLSDYRTLGTRIKCNPAIKKQADRDALRAAVNSGLIDVIATDHAPHLLSEKEGGALKAVSGMPTLQFSLVSIYELVHEGVLSIEQLVQKMCHAPAQLFQISKRGFIRPGYQATRCTDHAGTNPGRGSQAFAEQRKCASGHRNRESDNSGRNYHQGYQLAGARRIYLGRYSRHQGQLIKTSYGELRAPFFITKPEPT